MEVGPAVLRAVADALGGEVALLGATTLGESRSTFRIRVGGVDAALKVLPSGVGVLDDQRRLADLVAELQRRGSPVPRYLLTGAAGGQVFTVQSWLWGTPVNPSGDGPADPGLLQSVLPQVLDAVALQVDAGDLAEPPWPGEVLATIERGGNGYCVHDTMRRRPDTSMLLARLIGLAGRNVPGPVRRTDVVHCDLNPANLLHMDGRLTGIVDWSAPYRGAAQGDRGFDLATKLFYAYDSPDLRSWLWREAIAVSGIGWTCVYLAHLVLRQVEWTVRHRPGTPEERRYLHVADDVLNDCERITT